MKVILSFMLVFMLVGCASQPNMPYGQYRAIVGLCEQQGMKPHPSLGYNSRDKRMYTRTVVCYDQYGAPFDFSKE